LYIVSTSILVRYYILTWPKIGGWKMSIIIFKNVQWKSLSEKEIKKNHLFIQIIYWKIYAKKIQTHFSLYKTVENIFGKT
jgi:hypothetical protein